MSQIILYSDESLNQQRLDAIHFPEEGVLAEYSCVLSNQIMTEPYVLPNGLTVDRDQFLKACKKNDGSYVNCYTNSPFELSDSIGTINQELKDAINLFIQKAELVHTKFKNTYQEKYQTYAAEITNKQISLDKFQLLVTPKGSSLQKGFFGKKTETAKNNSIDQDLIKLTKEEYELNIRQTAAKGDIQKLTKLLTTTAFKTKAINIDAAGPKTGQTALHWVVLGAHKPENKEHLDKYKQCYQLLLGQGASVEVKDLTHKAPSEYDADNMFVEFSCSKLGKG